MNWLGLLEQLPRAGMSFSETMAGSWTKQGATESRPASFTVTAEVENLLAHLGEIHARLVGHVSFDGLATHRPLANGKLTIAPLTQGLLRYEFEFDGDESGHYRFVGEKKLKLDELVRTMTSLSAHITDASGKEVGSVQVKFNLESDLIKLLTSIRPRIG